MTLALISIITADQNHSHILFVSTISHNNYVETINKNSLTVVNKNKQEKHTRRRRRFSFSMYPTQQKIYRNTLCKYSRHQTVFPSHQTRPFSIFTIHHTRKQMESINRAPAEPTETAASNDLEIKVKIPPIFISNQNLDYNLFCESLVDIAGEYRFLLYNLSINLKAWGQHLERLLPNYSFAWFPKQRVHSIRFNPNVKILIGLKHAISTLIRHATT